MDQHGLQWRTTTSKSVFGMMLSMSLVFKYNAKAATRSNCVISIFNLLVVTRMHNDKPLAFQHSELQSVMCSGFLSFAVLKWSEVRVSVWIGLSECFVRLHVQFSDSKDTCEHAVQSLITQRGGCKPRRTAGYTGALRAQVEFGCMMSYAWWTGRNNR